MVKRAAFSLFSFLFPVLLFPLPASAQTTTGAAVFPAVVRPGEPVTVVVPASLVSKAGGTVRARLYAGGKEWAAAKLFDADMAGGKKAAFLGVSSLAPAGEAMVKVMDSGKSVFAELPFTIAEREFESETIKLSPSNTAIRTEPDKRKEEESSLLSSILYTEGSTIYHSGVFRCPLPKDTFRTSKYGGRRVYLYSNNTTGTSIHAGIDFRAAKGTPVYACARGRVALARPRINTGNSVVIEHLPGVYSLYYHLDSIAVREGSIVEAGALVGKSGETGLAEGPHLHWEIRVSAENTDPDAMMERALLPESVLVGQKTGLEE